MRKCQTPMPAARGFTLIEVSITVIIIAILAGLSLVAIGGALRGSREAAERQTLSALKFATVQFKNDFGFLPPLVDDVPTPVGPNGPVTHDPATNPGRMFLEGAAGLNPDERYSENSLQYYLMGVLDREVGNKPLDGATGPRFTKPNADGTFSQRGKAYDAYYDFSKVASRAVRAGDQITLNDRWGTPIRYYRWSPKSAEPNLGQILVPRSVGDPRTNPALRSAEFAIVSLGPDKATDDGRPHVVGDDNPAMPAVAASVKDNVVEVGP